MNVRPLFFLVYIVNVTVTVSVTVSQ